jgi:hypothetical protein
MAGKKTVAPGTKRVLLRDAKGRWVSSAEALPGLAGGETAPPNKAPPKRKAAAKKADPTKEEVAKAHATVVTKLLKNMELKLSGKDAKASLGDYIRLVQLQKELDDDAPREIRVTWVETGTETAEEAKPDTTSGSGE